MSEKEIIELVKSIDFDVYEWNVDEYNGNLDRVTFEEANQAIQGLLDIYKQEKEKNEKLINKIIQYDKTLEKLQKETIWKDKIKNMLLQREFELQQEYKEFEDDGEWKAYKKILEEV